MCLWHRSCSELQRWPPPGEKTLQKRRRLLAIEPSEPFLLNPMNNLSATAAIGPGRVKFSGVLDSEE